MRFKKITPRVVDQQPLVWNECRTWTRRIVLAAISIAPFVVANRQNIGSPACNYSKALLTIPLEKTN